MAKGYIRDEAFSTYDRKHLTDLYFSIPEKQRESIQLTEADIPFVLECVKAWSDLILKDSDFGPKLLNLVNEVYAREFHDGWEYCLDRKEGENKIHDYLYGCNSNCIDDPNAMAHRHSHQFCILTTSLDNGKDLLYDKLDSCLENAKTFEDLLALFREAPKDDIKGLGTLAIYDACLRIAWKENKELMPTMMYLHAGVRWGAEALYHISQLAPVDWYAGEVNPHKVSDYTPLGPHSFNGLLPELKDDKERTHHLENLLCCFHEPFFLIETALRVRKGEKLRLHPEKIKNGAPRKIKRLHPKKIKEKDSISPRHKMYLQLLDLLGYKE